MPRTKLTKRDYADMAEAASALSRGCGISARGKMNKALSDYYRALSVPVSAATEKGEESNIREISV